MNTTWFNNLPLFDEDKSLVLVFDLIKSEAVPAEKSFTLSVPTRSSGMMTCLARDYVGRAQQNTWTRGR